VNIFVIEKRRGGKDRNEEIGLAVRGYNTIWASIKEYNTNWASSKGVQH